MARGYTGTWHCFVLTRHPGCLHFGSPALPSKRESKLENKERGFVLQALRTRAAVVGESMGEEEKKPEEGKKEAAAAAPEGEKKAAPEEAKKEDKEEKKEEGKEKKDGEKGGGGDGEKKEGEEAPPPPPPPPPPEEVVMKVYMHCEGCARKVRRSLRGFEGVEAVMADHRLHRVVVKGRKAAEDPLKVVERVQRKSHRRVELISPIPPPKPEKKEEEKEEEKPKVEEKKEEPQVIVVLLKVLMHCEACALEIKKRILRMKGVQAAEADMTSSTVKVTGVFDPARLVAYVHKRTGKHAIVVKQEPAEKKPEVAPEKADGSAEAEAKDEKKAEAGEEKEKKEGGDGEKKAAEGAGGGEEKKEAAAATAVGEGVENETGKEKKNEGAVKEATVVAVVATAGVDGAAGKMRRNEFYYYYPRYPVEYAYPPQIFSDENPNACAVM